MVLEAQVHTKWWPMLTFPPINLWSIFTMNTKAVIPIEVQKTTNFMGFESKQCEFFPCHSNVIGEHNCLFCFCWFVRNVWLEPPNFFRGLMGRKWFAMFF